MMVNKTAYFLLIVFWAFSNVLFGKQTYGCLSVKTLKKVHDGDTFIADVSGVHPLIGDRISIRIRGIDAPEITDQRPHVKTLAIQARDYLAFLLKDSVHIELQNVGRDKYFRILADVVVDGVNVGEELLKANLVQPYDGKTKPSWK